MSSDIIADLAPTGVLRAGINFIELPAGDGEKPRRATRGASRPTWPAEIAARLGVPVTFMRRLIRPASLLTLADTVVWDIGSDPRGAAARRENYLHGGLCRDRGNLSGARRFAAEDDRGGRQPRRAHRGDGTSAYGLWLDRNIKHAELVRTDTLDSAYEQFVRDRLDAGDEGQGS